MIDKVKVERAIALLLEAIGEDQEREGLIDTPRRVAKMYEEVLEGMDQSAKEPLSKTFSAPKGQLIVEKDIEFHSLCEHHMLPFFGKVHIAYVSNEQVVGLSKLARTVEVFARRLQIQEQMTKQIEEAIAEFLQPQGVFVYVEAEHMCMTMRGVKKSNTKTVTTAMSGIFEENPELMQQVYFAIK